MRDSTTSEGHTFDRIVLTGFSGTGKSTVARLVAELLGWSAIDLDEQLADEFGMSIPAIFAEKGESQFREAERRLLFDALSLSQVVIATGGGAAATEDAWSFDLLGRPGVLTVALDAAPRTLLERLQRQQALDGGDAVRPMIEGDNPLARICELKSLRQFFYDRARISLVVDKINEAGVAAEIVSVFRSSTGTPAELTLNAVSGSSCIVVAPGLFHSAVELIAEAYPGAQRLWIVTDENVAPLIGDHFLRQMEAAGYPAKLFAVPPGESSKSIQGASSLYDWMLGGGIERGDVVVALGGGVVGDLAGFAAATVLRGVGLVQIPTSLLAMVDSSVGGKTGINHAMGKNLVGAFYQPPLVIVDPRLLATLPARELRQGWAEIIKHAVIQPSTPDGSRADLMTFLERNQKQLVHLDEPSLTYLIARNIALKTSVVQTDEREAGIRSLLNYGHTLGHALEATDYSLLHGEAIALGMQAANWIAESVTGFDRKTSEHIAELLRAFGLPSSSEADITRVMELTLRDKKRKSGKQQWVLPVPVGGVEVLTDIDPVIIEQSLRHIVADLPKDS